MGQCLLGMQDQPKSFNLLRLGSMKLKETYGMLSRKMNLKNQLQMKKKSKS